jgi:hypothetical protein
MSQIEIIDCEQGSDEWRKARAGIVTASEFSTVLASGRGGGESKTRKTYMMKLAGEILTGEPMENYSNGYMDRGHALEDEARQTYAFLTDADPQQVGFIKRGRAGYSPDSLISEDGLVEIKTKAPHLMIEVLLADKFPADHVAQCQGGLWVTGREWIDIVCYYPKMPVFIKRAYRDEAYIANLAGEVAKFTDELDALVAKISAYGVSEAA